MVVLWLCSVSSGILTGSQATRKSVFSPRNHILGTSLADLSSLTVLTAISRSHDEAQKTHGKQIHKVMEYMFLEYFHYCLVKLIFWHQFCRNL